VVLYFWTSNSVARSVTLYTFRLLLFIILRVTIVHILAGTYGILGRALKHKQKVDSKQH